MHFAGPIVRITPAELHIFDSDYFEKFYTLKLDKDPHYYNMTNLPLSGFGTTEHELHRKRRAALNPYFSRSNIDAQVPLVQGKTERLCKTFQQAAATGDVVRLDICFVSLTIDTVTECAFGISYGALGLFLPPLSKSVGVLWSQQ